ncbi:MAG: BatD family protein [Capnocytophaga sp.]|uniref:BatD family protein n=1 Tax=Capnocytophaga sp. TaxID=44737 RepID=UPI003FA03D43
MKYKIGFFLFFLIQCLAAQQVEFKAEVSKNQLGANERLRVEFSMNKNGDNFTPPNFQGFTVVMGPSQSVSESWINGVRSFSKTYIYVLQPTSKGNHTIGTASINIDGRTYKTSPIAITVTEAVKSPSIEKNSNDIARENLFLLAEVSKPNPYLNEAVSVTYRLYVGGQVSLSNLRALEVPKYPNFWSQDIKLQNYEIENCTYQGRNYRCIVVKKIVLYPQKTGAITLEPLTMEAILNVPSGQRDWFGHPFYEEVAQRVTSGSRTISVKSLPEEGKPENFSGAVGDFSFSVRASKQTLKANESTQLKIDVSGSGNFKLFDLPKPTFPSSLEVYSPEQKEDVNTSLTGMKGRIEQTYTIVPEYKGKYPITGLNFSYFNPTTQKYETVRTDDIWLDVTEGPTANNSDADSVAAQPSVPTAVGNLQMATPFLPIGQQGFFGSTAYYCWLFLPLFFIPLVLFWWRIREQRAGDVEGNKVRVANRLVKKYLSEAKHKLGNKGTFYEALERALHNYLKAKLKIETTEMTKDKITEYLLGKQANQTTVEQFIALLASCERARYAQHSDALMEKDFSDAVQIISELDKQLKK